MKAVKAIMVMTLAGSLAMSMGYPDEVYVAQKTSVRESEAGKNPAKNELRKEGKPKTEGCKEKQVIATIPGKDTHLPNSPSSSHL